MRVVPFIKKENQEEGRQEERGWVGGHLELEAPLRYPREGGEKAAECTNGELWGKVQAGAINV